MSERTVDISPRPAALTLSLRGLGYSPEAALSDLIDNSITAGARTIELDLQWNDGQPSAAILDDGCGMNEECLAEALRLGGRGPDSERQSSDLGRFGMGMKTSSLSQSSRMTVVARSNGADNVITLDVAVMDERGWVALIPDHLPDNPFVSRLRARNSGTLILWEGIDELSGLFGLQKEPFFLRLEEIRVHLGMVFHRFINGDASRVAIMLNGRAVKSWDPFQTAHPATREMPLQRVRHAGSSFTVKPYVLPHCDRFTNEAEYLAAGGPGGWGARQGFYVYRGRRLLVAGSWLGLGGARTWTRDEASRLARIEIDLPTDLDRDWRIDVRKSQARPPGALRGRLTAIAARCREEAREVFAFRGQGPRMRGALHTVPPIWVASPGPQRTRYRINRDHPVIVACREAAPGIRPLNAVLSLIERSVPVERIWLDVSENEGAEVPTMDPEEAARLADQLAELGRTLPAAMTLDQRVDVLLLNLPGNVAILKKELVKRLGDQA